MMILGATTAVLDIIKCSFPEDCDDIKSGLLIFFQLVLDESTQRVSLGLGAHEPKYLIDATKVDLDGLEVYFSVPDDYAKKLKNCILHFNAYTKEFEPIEVVLANR